MNSEEESKEASGRSSHEIHVELREATRRVFERGRLERFVAVLVPLLSLALAGLAILFQWLAHKDYIAYLQHSLLQKDETIAENEKAIKQKDNTIIAKDADIKKKQGFEDKIADLTRLVASRAEFNKDPDLRRALGLDQEGGQGKQPDK